MLFARASENGHDPRQSGARPTQYFCAHRRAGAGCGKPADHHFAGRAGGSAIVFRPGAGDASGQPVQSRPCRWHASRSLRDAADRAAQRLSARDGFWLCGRTGGGMGHLCCLIRDLLHRHVHSRFLRCLRAELPLRGDRCHDRRTQGQGDFLGDDRWPDRRGHRPATRDLDPRCGSRDTLCRQLSQPGRACIDGGPGSAAAARAKGSGRH